MDQLKIICKLHVTSHQDPCMEAIGESTDNLHYTGVLNHLFVRMQWKTRTRCTCFTEESRLLAACRTENDRLSGLSSRLWWATDLNKNRVYLYKGNTARAVGNVLFTRRQILAHFSKACCQAKTWPSKTNLYHRLRSTYNLPGNCIECSLECSFANLDITQRVCCLYRLPV